jgi:hypothetical protein
MLRLMTARAADASRRPAGLKVKAVFLAALGLTLATAAQAQNGKIGATPQATYDNKYEVYGGINYMNFQAGQDLPKRMNLGGAEVMGTYWLNNRLGIAGDYRFEGGTTPVLPSPASFRPSRQLVFLNMGMAGVQYRGPKNHYAAVDYHALVGVAHGQFEGPTNFDVGLYTDRTKPVGAFGGSLDYNRTKNLAFRLQPDLIIEHFGSEYREFFAISAGVIYRFGKQ